MNQIDPSQLLLQMRAMAAAAQNETPPAAGGNSIGSDFGDLLKQSINTVNDIQQTSGRLSEAFVMGDSSVSLAEVMIAKQKAGIAFEATVQVRNKLLNAYKEIMAMSV